MRNRLTFAMACSTLSVLMVGSGPAVAGSISATPSPTPEFVLGQLEDLVGTTIAGVINNPDQEFISAPPAVNFGTEGTDAREEANARLIQGLLRSQLVFTAGNKRLVATVEGSICPNEQGQVSVNIVMTTATESLVNPIDDKLTLKARARGVVNDDANLEKPTVTVEKGKGSDAAQLTKLGLAVLRQAETAWQNGHCVKLDVTEGASRTVKPMENVAISATAKPRFGSGQIKGRTESKKTGGQKKVTPAKTSASPAKFTYTAPDKAPNSGSVQLRSVSRRGIAVADLEYTTAGDLKIDALLEGFWQLKAVKCNGAGGTWDIAGTLSDDAIGNEQISLTLSEDTLSGPWHSTGQVSSPAGSREINESGVAHLTMSPDGKSGTLDFSPGSVPVTTGTFCTNGVPNPG